MKPIVIVTQPEYDKAQSVFDSADNLDCRPAPADECELAQELRRTGSRIAVLGTLPYKNELYSALAENARGGDALIIRFGFGMDSVNKSLCEANGITLTNTPVDIQTSVAELTIFLLGSLLRSIPRFNAAIRSGEFKSERGRELAGKTALLLGGGRIGMQVARMLHLGFAVETLICDAMPEAAWRERTGVSDDELRQTCGITRYSDDLDTLLPQADILSIHLPLMESTRGLIDARRLALMKPGAFLINTSRGGIVDEAALHAALAGGQLAGAAMDVFAAEPYQPTDPARDLRTLPNMVMTPHCASDTVEANSRMAARAVEIAASFNKEKL
jgi:lactate dehydrogenase-like 2-hydroxyacid dehydrogenase